jgi:hypothetical protein
MAAVCLAQLTFTANHSEQNKDARRIEVDELERGDPVL